MSNILKRLHYLEFPECTKEALVYLTKCLTRETGGIPGLGGGNEDFAMEVSQAYILFSKGTQKKLSAIQELQLLEMLCTCIQELKDVDRCSVFSIIFSGKADASKTTLLTKLVSMAMSVKCAPVLDCAAMWMQEQGCGSLAVQTLARTVVEDYCQLFPAVVHTFQILPTISPLFACNLIAAVTLLFPCNDISNAPPLNLVEYVTTWISLDHSLCSLSIRQTKAHSGPSQVFTTHGSSPFPGLTDWCVKGPVLCSQYMDKNRNSWESVTASRPHSIFSKLHLGVLQSLLACQGIGSEELIIVGDLKKTSKELVDICNQLNLSQEEECNSSVERLGQIVQVSLATQTLKARDEQLGELSHMLPPNRLFQLIMLHQGRYGEVQDY